MIKKVEMFYVVCDNCGVSCFEGSDYSCTVDEVSAKEVASDSDWIIHEGKDYCQECYSYDDNDEIVIKTIVK